MTEAQLMTMALTKARNSTALEHEWSAALARMASSGVSDGNMQRLFEASASPVVFSRLARMISGDADDKFAAIAKACDRSCHSLEEWLEAIDAVFGWLENRSRTTTLENAIGYVACTSAVSNNENLPQSVKKMLEEYGVDRI
jgi:hypothetical protein